MGSVAASGDIAAIYAREDILRFESPASAWLQTDNGSDRRTGRVARRSDFSSVRPLGADGRFLSSFLEPTCCRGERSVLRGEFNRSVEQSASASASIGNFSLRRCNPHDYILRESTKKVVRRGQRARAKKATVTVAKSSRNPPPNRFVPVPLFPYGEKKKKRYGTITPKKKKKKPCEMQTNEQTNPSIRSSTLMFRRHHHRASI